MKWLDKKEELTKLIVKEKISYQEIGRMYGVTGTAIKKAAIRLGIPIVPKRAINPNETFRKGTAKKGVCLNCGKEFILYQSHTGKYCCHECWAEHIKKKRIEKWKAGLISGTTGFSCCDWVKNYMLEKVGNKCEKCGWGVENPYTHKIPLQIHHKDGNSLNNKEDNLQVLCPNCHTLTENFGSRNKNAPNGKSQYYRRA